MRDSRRNRIAVISVSSRKRQLVKRSFLSLSLRWNSPKKTRMSRIALGAKLRTTLGCATKGSSFSGYSRNKISPGLASLRRVTSNRKFEPLGSNQVDRPRRRQNIFRCRVCRSSSLPEVASSLEISGSRWISSRETTHRVRNMSFVSGAPLREMANIASRRKSDGRDFLENLNHPKSRSRYADLRDAMSAKGNFICR